MDLRYDIWTSGMRLVAVNLPRGSTGVLWLPICKYASYGWIQEALANLSKASSFSILSFYQEKDMLIKLLKLNSLGVTSEADIRRFKRVMVCELEDWTAMGYDA